MTERPVGHRMWWTYARGSGRVRGAGRTPGASAGFTLLEVLVALVVFGLLMAGLAGGVRFGLLAWGTQSRMVARDADLDGVERVLRGVIARIEPGRPVDPPNIVGTASSLVFTSAFSGAPPPDPPGGSLPSGSGTRADMLLRVDGGRLVLRWTPHLHVRRLVTPPPPASVVLLDGVERLELAYWSDDAGWTERWDGRAPPSLIRLRLRFATGDARHWPDIVAAPMRRPIEG